MGYAVGDDAAPVVRELGVGNIDPIDDENRCGSDTLTVLAANKRLRSYCGRLELGTD